ncbi:MAG: ferritin-like domain-containing protein [Vicinamibacterales bacterium]
MAAMEDLRDLLVEELHDVYDAEHRITKALPKMRKAAGSEELKEAFDLHLQETEGQIDRLERIFALLDEPAKRKKCDGILGLIEEGDAKIGEDAHQAVLDAALIASAQKVEHYEIASYGTMRTYAQLLGNNEVAALLEETLQEEKAADEKLTALAEAGINEAAAQGEDDEDEEETPATPQRWAAAARGGSASRRTSSGSRSSKKKGAKKK